MSKAFIIGYDPGGDGAHGVAILEVQKEHFHWTPVILQITTMKSLQDVITWLENSCCDGYIIAAGVDTLTEWNSGRCGWRPADLWLRKMYPEAQNSVVSSNSIYGSMAVNGAAFLLLLAPRFQTDHTIITETHPKVCYFALTGKKHIWKTNSRDMTAWLLKELSLAGNTNINDEHCFDAGMTVLSALCGLNQDWKLDLHALPGNKKDGCVRFMKQTHFWWPLTNKGLRSIYD
jgi:hypothetical protein